jgi:hypothetical protein
MDAYEGLRNFSPGSWGTDGLGVLPKFYRYAPFAELEMTRMMQRIEDLETFIQVSRVNPGALLSNHRLRPGNPGAMIRPIMNHRGLYPPGFDHPMAIDDFLGLQGVFHPLL